MPFALILFMIPWIEDCRKLSDPRLHHQAKHTNLPGLFGQNLICKEIFSCAISIDNGPDQILGNFGVIREKLLSIFGQTVAAVSKTRVVVVTTNTRIEADAVDDLARVHTAGDRIAVELVEEGHAHCEVSVCEKLDSLGLGCVSVKDFHILLFRALQQEVSEYPGPLRSLSDDDARGVEVVVKSFASRKNSGLNTTWSVLKRARTSSTKPTGIVDLITIVALLPASIAVRITASTEEVSNLSVSRS